MKTVKFDSMIGKTFVKVSRVASVVVFQGVGGTFKLFHEQDCCEHVWIESIAGDLVDLEGSPILIAEEVSNITEDMWEGANKAKVEEVATDDTIDWTFYKFATVKGHVTVRFVGVSNGYYSVKACMEYDED